MNKIYHDYEDQHVAARLVYAKPEDAKAYADAAFTKTIDAATLINAFQKGCLIVAGENTYAPVSLNVNAGVATIGYVTVDPETATTAVMATLVSTEPTA